ncbi:MAG: signal peptide peptidase SppA [Phycisphaerales bacterium]|nr:signal peptide peptidase SppA [Phycisphaerales bacterium]MCB9836522.1 signal peptide peptidase SppA [Phycisphaera sp.]
MRCLALALALTLVCTLGCVPKSVTIQLKPDRGQVEQSVVFRDKLGGPKIAQIDLTGVIASASTSAFGSAALLDDMALMFERAETDPGIRAVILRINSPGGSVAASETLADMIEGFKARTGKPVVASMAEVAASGGYYTAITADTIVAQPSTITGSVGVIVPTLNVADGLARIGIKSRSVISGPNKDIANPLQPMNEAHYAILQGIVDEFYADFRARVVAARPGIENPDDVLDGSVYTGRQALELGLVDKLGGISEAFDEAKRLAGLDSAVLVKLHRGGPTPMTPYASVEAPNIPQQESDPIGSVLGWQNRIRQHGANDPGFYYLWLPPSSLGLD